MTSQAKGSFTTEDNIQAVQTLNKRGEAYVQIKNRIISGECKPDSLLVERTFSDFLDMSRTPIRAAFMDPCHMGLAAFVPGRGIHVSIVGHRDTEEIYEIRALLDPTALLPFMKQTTRDQTAMPHTFADNMRDAMRMGNTGILIENDVNFHQYYTDYCGNVRPASIICSTVNLFHRFRYIASSSMKVNRIFTEEYLLIMKAIENNDQVETELQMRAHYSHLKCHLTRKLISGGQL